MFSRDKDYFETILKDVKPLKRKKSAVTIPLERYEKIKTKKEPKKTPTVIEKKNKSYEKNIVENDLTFNKKIKKRKILINKKIDLHGFSLFEAEKKFDSVIQYCFNKNIRCILFVTGKGLKNLTDQTKKNKLYFGKIKSNIKNWAFKVSNKEKILYINEANIEHGGAGAYYVYIRKKKNIS